MTKVRVREEAPAEKGLRQWFEKQEIASVDNLEAAARLIITLITSMLTILFGVLAVAGDPLPAYFRYPNVRYLGVASVIFLLLALVAALIVVLPLRLKVASARPDKQREAFDRILQRKSWALLAAVVTFALGLIALGIALIAALLVTT